MTEHVSHSLLGVFGFGCALVPLLARIPGPPRAWAAHATLATAMGVMVVTGMTGAARPMLAVLLLLLAGRLYVVLPQRREHLHVAVDAVVMALLMLLVGGEAVGSAGHHESAGPAWVAPTAVFGFWAALQAACLLSRYSRPCARDMVSSLGMIGAMTAMALLP
jgi:hypothetical protein